MALFVCWVAYPLLLALLSLGCGLLVERAAGTLLSGALLVPAGPAGVIVAACLATTTGAAVAVFAVFAAPIVLGGSATFAGYITLDDTASFLGMTDRVMEHGRSLAGLAPSTYRLVPEVNLARGYPVGSFMPLGVGHVLVRQDVAWLFQPTLAFYAAVLSLSLAALARPLVR